MQVVFASANAHKISEVKAMLPEGITVIGLQEIDFTGEIPETGSTILDNSKMKARFIFDFLREKNLNWPVFADDSGLEVDALNGAPGVDTAIYAGVHGDHEGNNSKLLNALQNVTDRRARFVTNITFISESDTISFEGEVHGTIAYEPRGLGGFGYDPLFIPRGFRSTFAELGAEVKNQVSHRARAVEQLAAYLSRK